MAKVPPPAEKMRERERRERAEAIEASIAHLRRLTDEAVAAVERPDDINKATIARTVVLDGFIKKSTAYKHIDIRINEILAERALRAPEVAEAEPPPLVPVRAGSPRLDHLAVIQRLQKLIDESEKVIKYSLHTDGSVRNPKLLLSAIDQLRKAVEASVKLQESIHVMLKIQAYQQAVQDTLREESPDGFERLLKRLRTLDIRSLAT